MGRIPCCEKDNVKRGQWTPEEDNKLLSYIAQHGTRNWRLIPKNAGLQRCGKSCRLRWTNYLRPDLKHGEFSEAEEQTIMKLHSVLGNRWSLIAAQLPGRTDNDVKNYWNTKLKKKLSGMGIDPVTHKPFSHLMAEIATTLPPPHMANLAEAALGCFKDEMLHLFTKKRVNFHLQQPGSTSSSPHYNMINGVACKNEDGEGTIEKIKLGLSRAIQDHDNDLVPSSGFLGSCNDFPSSSEFQYGHANMGSDGDGSSWNVHPNVIEPQSELNGGIGNGIGEESEGGKDGRNGCHGLFNSDCVLWDLPSDDIMNQIV